MVAVSLVDYRTWQRWAPGLYAVNLLSAALHSARRAQRARRAALDLARTAGHVSTLRAGKARDRDRACRRSLPRNVPELQELWKPLATVAYTGALILKQPDLGTSLVLLAILSVELFFALPKLGDFGIYALGMLVVAAAALGTNAVLKPFQRARLFVFLNPKADPQGAGYNLNQSKIAVGNGEWFGRGLYHGTQTQFNFVPEHSRDFIFTVLAEEWGFAGAPRCSRSTRRALRRGSAIDAGGSRPVWLPARRRVGRDALLSRPGQSRDDDRDHADHRHPASVHVLRRLGDADRFHRDGDPAQHLLAAGPAAS